MLPFNAAQKKVYGRVLNASDEGVSEILSGLQRDMGGEDAWDAFFEERLKVFSSSTKEERDDELKKLLVSPTHELAHAALQATWKRKLEGQKSAKDEALNELLASIAEQMSAPGRSMGLLGMFSSMLKAKMAEKVLMSTISTSPLIIAIKIEKQVYKVALEAKKQKQAVDELKKELRS